MSKHNFFQTPIKNFSLPITNLKDWFPKEIVRNKRAKIAEIIRTLAVSQNPEKKFHFPMLEFVGSGAGYSDDEDEDMDADDRESQLDNRSSNSSSVVISTSTGTESQISTSSSDHFTNNTSCDSTEGKIQAGRYHGGNQIWKNS